MDTDLFTEQLMLKNYFYRHAKCRSAFCKFFLFCIEKAQSSKEPELMQNFATEAELALQVYSEKAWLWKKDIDLLRDYRQSLNNLYKEIDEFEEEEDKHHCHHDHECHCHEHDEEHECHCHEHGHECHCGHHHEDGHDHVEEYGIKTFVYYRREPMDRKKFYEFISKPWPKKIIRAKGITYFKDDKDMSYMFEQAGSLKDITEAGPWLITQSPKLIEEVLKENKDLEKDRDEFYGGRRVKIVFIGKGNIEEEIRKELDQI